MKRVDFKKVSIVNFLSIGDEPVTVDELYTGHVTQVIDRFLKTQSKIKVKEWNPECLQIEFFGKRFDVMVFDLEEEARNEVAESRRS